MPYTAAGELRIVPVTFAQAKAFIAVHHRHHGPPLAYRLTVGVSDGAKLRGVAVAGRPSCKELDDGLTLEVTRTCTDGARNANSLMYGAIWRAARAIGYARAVTYTQDGESGASLRAAGWTPVASVRARPDHHVSGVGTRWSPRASDGIPRTRWEIGALPETRNARVTGTRLCGGCAHRFAPARADARYCSAACRQRAYRRRQAA
jgi:hypothetical protein